MKTDADAGQVIRVLDGKYNCQIAASIRYLYSAKILHFFNARFFAHNNIHPFYSSDFYLRVRNEGFTHEIDEMINNVRMLFDAYSTPISRPEFEYLSSPEGHIMMALREKCGWKWSVMSIILKILEGFLEYNCDFVVQKEIIICSKYNNDSMNEVKDLIFMLISFMHIYLFDKNVNI